MKNKNNKKNEIIKLTLISIDNILILFIIDCLITIDNIIFIIKIFKEKIIGVANFYTDRDISF